MVPTISPMKSHVVTASDQSMLAEIPLASPRKPMHQPIPRGGSHRQYFGSAAAGWVSTSIKGR